MKRSRKLQENKYSLLYRVGIEKQVIVKDVEYPVCVSRRNALTGTKNYRYGKFEIKRSENTNP